LASTTGRERRKEKKHVGSQVFERKVAKKPQGRLDAEQALNKKKKAMSCSETFTRSSGKSTTDGALNIILQGEGTMRVKRKKCLPDVLDWWGEKKKEGRLY